MNRPRKYWLWLLADLSLDRNAEVLPLIGFPQVDVVVFRHCLQILGARLDPLQENVKLLYQEVQNCLSENLGDRAKEVDKWLRTFPFSDEASIPAAYYWDSRFADLFALDPAPVPRGVEPLVWKAILSAYRGETSNPGHLWTQVFNEAADVMTQYRAVSSTIEAARRRSLTSYDLDLYLRFGWNDDGTQKGLASLEIGARLLSAIWFWRAISGNIPDHEVEAIAYQRDMQTWEVAANPGAFSDDAKRYGVSPQEMAAEVFPKPSRPPALATLCKGV